MRTNQFLAFVVVVMSVSLLQFHGIDFWMSQAGKFGVLWSVSLEISAIYLWLHKQVLPAIIASSLLVVGPLYQISYPLIEKVQSQQREIISSSLSSAKEEVSGLEASLRVAEANSTKRPGWAPMIKYTQERLRDARARKNELLEKESVIVNGWQSTAVIFMESAALLVVLYSQVFALSQVRNGLWQRTTKTGGDESESDREVVEIVGISTSSKSESDAESDFERKVKIAVGLVEKRLADFGGKRQLLAQYVGVRPSDISLLSQHEKRIRNGRETISRPALEKIVSRLTA